MPPPNEHHYYSEEGTLGFIETARYYASESSSSHSNTRPTIPYPWRNHNHPNGDVYYYNPELRLITPDDIRNAQVLRYVMEARTDHLQWIVDDPNFRRLPPDWELTVSDVSEDTSVIGMYSRMAGAAFEYTEERGLVIKSKEHFWSHVAEFPSHHVELPPNTEQEFVRSLNNAKAAVANGIIFPFSARQIEQVIGRYQYLKSLQARGSNVTPALAWLMGAVMPMDAVGKTMDDGDLEALMSQLRF
ncbi:hypothetical protein BDQ17DRAFT_1390274 [Cyathus striatus]|nr:hypothetical protein BDQ17DRAFT_1390274 [Cyathus striatus]